MPALINWELMRQPLNWLTIFLMCSFALVLFYLVAPEQSGA